MVIELLLSMQVYKKLYWRGNTDFNLKKYSDYKTYYKVFN